MAELITITNLTLAILVAGIGVYIKVTSKRR